MSTRYTISGLYNQRSKLQDMIIKLIATVQQADYTEGTTGDFTYMLDDTMFVWDIKYIRKPIKNDLSCMTVVSAALKLGKNPFLINFDSSDFLGNDMPPAILDILTEALISNLAVHMARTWYVEEGMEESITTLAEMKDFNGIRSYLEIEMELGYSDRGYIVSIFDVGGNLIVKDEHASALPDSRDPTNTNFHVFLRYLTSGIVLLLASQGIRKDKWSALLI